MKTYLYFTARRQYHRRIISLCSALFQVASLMSGKPPDVFSPIFAFQAYKICPYNVRTHLFKEKWLNTETPTEECHEYFCGEYKLLVFLICSPSSKHCVTISCCIATSLEGIYFFLHTSSCCRVAIAIWVRWHISCTPVDLFCYVGVTF